jgi:hypothetical protein
MTTEEYFALFSKAMREKRIIRYENSGSRDEYHTYAIRETPMGYIFFCLLETYFKTGINLNEWLTGSLRSFHEFSMVRGATVESLCLTDDFFEPVVNYREMLPALESGENGWQTLD